MLLRISAGMGISETLAGQFVTLYAIGSVAAAVPLTTATQAGVAAACCSRRWPRS